MSPSKRKYLPAEGYRFLALVMLRHRGARGASKGELAWETRANHYMATRLLRELAEEGLIMVEGGSEEGFRLRISREGERFLSENGAYGVRTFRDALREHFRVGRGPEWVEGLGL